MSYNWECLIIKIAWYLSVPSQYNEKTVENISIEEEQSHS